LIKYREAGIPVRYDEKTWKDLVYSYSPRDLKVLAQAGRELKRGIVGADWILLYGRPMRVRSLTEALLMRAACDGGLSAMATDLPGLIDVEFDKGRKGPGAYGVDVLSLEVGREPPNKWNRVVIEKALRRRWGDRKFLLLVVHGDPSRLASLYKSALVEESLSDRFVKIGVESE